MDGRFKVINLGDAIISTPLELVLISYKTIYITLYKLYFIQLYVYLHFDCPFQEVNTYTHSYENFGVMVSVEL